MNMESLIKLSSVKRYAKGAVLAQEGDTATGEMFFLLQGTIGAIENHGTTSQTQVASFGSGSFFGELTLFLGKPQPATLVAQTNSVALALNRQNINEFFVSQPELTFMFVEGVCRKLDGSEEECRRLRTLLQAAGTAVVEQALSQSSALFPEGHGSYLLRLDNKNREYLYEQSITCPMCGDTFQNLTILTSRMKLDHTGSDLRSHYKDIEPLYYDIVTCPSCFYSSLTDSFASGSRNLSQRVYQEVAPYKSELLMSVKSGVARDSFTVFAGYYLALMCAPICLDDYQLTTANLWLKLSRVYQDAEDETMCLYACTNALADYKYSYEHFNINGKVMQQLCYLMGDLEYRLGNEDAARNYFFMAKSNRAGTTVLSRQSDKRLDEIRENRRKQQQ